MKNQIILEENTTGKLAITVSKDLTWPQACLMLFGAVQHLADTTVDLAYNMLPEDQQTKEARSEIAADMADMINYAATNVLNELSPRDPDLQLTEVAIATMENEIIQKAAKEHKSLKEALKEYEAELAKSPYAAKPLGQNGKRPSKQQPKKQPKKSKN